MKMRYQMDQNQCCHIRPCLFCHLLIRKCCNIFITIFLGFPISLKHHKQKHLLMFIFRIPYPRLPHYFKVRFSVCDSQTVVFTGGGIFITVKITTTKNVKDQYSCSLTFNLQITHVICLQLFARYWNKNPRIRA